MAPIAKRSKTFGITTYIRDTLCGGRPFKRSIKSGVLKRGRAGLALGRSIDRSFARSIECKSVAAGARIRVAAIHSALKRVGITAVQAQVAAKKNQISTFADAIGTTKTKDVVIIELKCTTAKKSDHLKIYHMCCENQGAITSGGKSVPNSEYVKHQLQTGFAMNAKSVKFGVVVVSCTDGALCYPVEKYYCEEHWFNHPCVRVPCSGTVLSPALLWPPAATCLGRVDRLIDRRVAILKCGGTAIVGRKHLSQMKRTEMRAAAKLLLSGQSPYYILEIGKNKKWRARAINIKTFS